jgi:hypothetical protein
VNPPKAEGGKSPCRDQFAESGEDIARHVSRQIRDLPSTKAFDKLSGRGGRLRLEVDKPVALVLGSGWGAHAMVKVVDTEAYEVACVSPRSELSGCPSLHVTGHCAACCCADVIRSPPKPTHRLPALCRLLSVYAHPPQVGLLGRAVVAWVQLHASAAGIRRPQKAGTATSQCIR